MTVWCGFGTGADDGRATVGTVMEQIYRQPFERFARYVPTGSPAEVADALGPYIDAGCSTFNLLAHAADPTAVIPAAAEVKRRLLGA